MMRRAATICRVRQRLVFACLKTTWSLGPRTQSMMTYDPRVVDAFPTGDVLCFSRARTNRIRGPTAQTYRLIYSLDNDARTAILTATLNVIGDALQREQRYAWGERLFSAFVPDAKLSEFGRTMFADQEFLADYERFDRQNYRSFDRKFAR